MNWLDPSCPWSGWQLANLMTCEARQCSWVRQPWNTLSNLGFWLVAFLLWQQFKKHRFSTDRDFTWLALGTGLASGLAHASQARFFSYFDFALTSALFFYCLGLNLQRWFKNRWSAWPWWRSALFAISLGVPLLHLTHTLFLLAVVASATLYTGLRAQTFEPARETQNLIFSLVTLCLAVVFFSLDATKVFCMPDSWINLHALWHLLTALALWTMATHYRCLQQKPRSI